MFEKYQKYKGKLSEEEFNALLPYAQDTLMKVVDEHVPLYLAASLDLKENRFLKALFLQLDYLKESGGIEMLTSGSLNLGIKEVETSGFKISYGSGAKVVGGLPISALAYNELLRQLRYAGLTYRGIQ